MQSMTPLNRDLCAQAQRTGVCSRLAGERARLNGRLRKTPRDRLERGIFMTQILAFLIGVFAGLRSLTPPALVAWAASLGWLGLEPPLSFIGSLPSVMILTLLAVGELVADKLPRTPKRTAAPGLIARMLTGGVAGACVAVGSAQAALPGAVLGVAGALVGAFVGYHVRSRLVQRLGIQDIYVALVEDLVAVAGCLWIVSVMS